MASLNQVTLELKVTGERQATKALKDFAEAGNKVGTSVGQLGRKLSSIEGEWKSLSAANRRGVLDAKALESAKRKLAKQLSDLTGQTISESKATLTAIKNSEARAIADRQAAQAAQELAKQKKLQQAIDQREIQSYNQLRAVIDQSYAARMRLKQAADTLRAAERQGLITREQAIEQLRQYQAAARAAGAAGNMAARRTNQLGVLMQQTGYQVGDFAVQVQSGTNVMVALGQQATQLVGTFGMLAKSTRMIGLFAGLGIAIPILTAIAGALMRVKNEAELTEEPFNELRDTLTNIQEIRLDGIAKEFAEQAEAAKQSFNDILGILERVEARTLKQQLEAPLMAVIREIESFDYRSTVMGRYGEVDFESTFGLKSRQEAIFLATQLRRLDGETKEELQQQAESISEALYLRGLLTPEIEAMLAKLAEQLSIQQDVNSEAEKNTEETNKIEEALSRQVTHQMQIATLQKEINDGVNEILASRDAELQRLEDQTKINNLILKYGEDSNQVTEAKLALEREIFRAKQIENGILGNNLKLVMDAYDAYVASQTAVDNVAKATEKSKNIFSELFDMLRNASMDNLLTQFDLLNAKIGAAIFGSGTLIGRLQRGFNAALAAAQAAQGNVEARITQATTPGGPGGLLPQDPSAEFQQTYDPSYVGYTYDKLAESLRGGTSGAGTGAARVQEDYLKKLQEEADQKLRMIGLSEEQQRYQEIVNELQERELEIDDERIKKIIETEEAIKEASEAESRRQNIMRTINSSIETAFMGLIDGSKSVEDAFTGMIRAILEEIAMQAIVKPIASGITGFLSDIIPNANGNAFSGGNVIPFANGGVVGGPTAFPMSGGRMGLMGEAGPEAIMPLKRGKGGKLGVVAEGGGGNVTVQNHFHIAANGDDSVKRIIAQEAPKIANLTQKQVLEARSRGGAFRTTFGA